MIVESSMEKETGYLAHPVKQPSVKTVTRKGWIKNKGRLRHSGKEMPIPAFRSSAPPASHLWLYCSLLCLHIESKNHFINPHPLCFNRALGFFTVLGLCYLPPSLKPMLLFLSITTSIEEKQTSTSYRDNTLILM